MSPRIERIEEMLKDSPQDQFLRYSLAMELRKQGESERCTELFRGLIEDSPPHVPAFLMLAQYFSENHHIDEARDVLAVGIDTARQQGDLHAAGEMSDLLAVLAEA